MSFHTKVAGVTFDGRQRVASKLKKGQKLLLVRDKNNPYDSNAVMVTTELNEQVGFLSKAIVSDLARKMDLGTKYFCEVSDVTGGNIGQSFGVNIFIHS